MSLERSLEITKENGMLKQLPLALLLLRLGIFIVFLAWTPDKFVQPEHAARVFAAFYGLGSLGVSRQIFFAVDLPLVGRQSTL